MEKNTYDSISVRAIILNNKKLLVEWLASLSICFPPGGTVEVGESLTETLERELSEELTVGNPKIGYYLGRIGHRWIKSDGKQGSCLNHFFEVSYPANVIEAVRAKEDGRVMKWLELDSSLTSLLQPPSLTKLVPQLGSSSRVVWNVVDDESNSVSSNSSQRR